MSDIDSIQLAMQDMRRKLLQQVEQLDKALEPFGVAPAIVIAKKPVGRPLGSSNEIKRSHKKKPVASSKVTPIKKTA